MLRSYIFIMFHLLSCYYIYIPSFIPFNRIHPSSFLPSTFSLYFHTYFLFSFLPHSFLRYVVYISSSFLHPSAGLIFVSFSSLLSSFLPLLTYTPPSSTTVPYHVCSLERSKGIKQEHIFFHPKPIFQESTTLTNLSSDQGVTTLQVKMYYHQITVT